MFQQFDFHPLPLLAPFFNCVKSCLADSTCSALNFCLTVLFASLGCKSCNACAFKPLKSRSFSQVSSIKTFDFSTLYTTLPNDKLKTRLKETIHKAFSHRNYGSKFVVFSMLEFLIDNIYLCPLEGHCFSRLSAYQWVRIVPLS